MPSRTHGRSGTPEYQSWAAMWQRCTNPKNTEFQNYGGRGIRVCERWSNFESFLTDMGARPDGMTIDRYPDKNGNYEPNNCRWATPMQQASNRRGNRIVDVDGTRMTLYAALRHLGVKETTFEARIARGWSLERALDPRLAVRTRKPNEPRGAQ